ncbi:MAG: M56 family metallopeptidase [Burkholderiales bacterium]|nr:M56 family metallopeptidase [Burkholderiales bacterium]
MIDVMTRVTIGEMMQLVLESALRATALGMGIWGVSRLARVRRAVHAWTLWIGVLAASVLMPALVVLTPRAVAGEPADATSASVVHGVATAAADLGLYGPVVGLAYLGIAGLLLLRVGIGVFSLARAWRTATPIASLSSVSVRVRCSDVVVTPVATGAGILLPTEWPRWSADTRACVLSHERSHLVRKDFYWQLLAQMYAAVFWFNPFAWLLLRKIIVLSEHVSDDAAVATIGRPVDYAAMLLHFAGRRQHTLLAVGMARPATVSLRIERILQGAPSASVGRAGRTVLAGCMVPAVLLSAFSPRLRVLDRAEDTSRVARLNTANVARLNTANVARLNTANVARLNTANVARLNTANVARLNTANVARLNTANVARLNTANVARLNTANVARLNTANVARLNTSRMAPLNTSRTAPTAPLR